MKEKVPKRKTANRKTPKRTTLYEGKYKRLVVEDGWEFMEKVKNCQVVVVLAVNDDGKLLLVEQYRVPVGRSVIELPAGLANDLDSHPDESLADAARRELLEETGYEAGEMKVLLRGPLAAAGVPDIMTLFRASRLRKAGPGGGDHTESITVHEVPLAKIHDWIREKESAGFWVDPKVYAGLYLLAHIES